VSSEELRSGSAGDARGRRRFAAATASACLDVAPAPGWSRRARPSRRERGRRARPERADARGTHGRGSRTRSGLSGGVLVRGEGRAAPVRQSTVRRDDVTNCFATSTIPRDDRRAPRVVKAGRADRDGSVRRALLAPAPGAMQLYTRVGLPMIGRLAPPRGRGSAVLGPGTSRPFHATYHDMGPPPGCGRRGIGGSRCGR